MAPPRSPTPLDRRLRQRRTTPAFARHPGDAVRVVLALLLLALTIVAVQRDRLTLFERDLFRLVNDLPDVLWPVLVVVMRAGNFAAGPIAAGAAFLAGARRMALDLLIAGPLAWFLARVVKGLVERPRPGGFFDDLVRQETIGGLGFVSGHTAVATALATVAAPYLPRRARRVVWGLALLVGFARVYAGAHLPLDIVGGAAVGWGVGALVHLALGAPRSDPAPAAVTRLLARAGLAVTDVVPAPGRARGSIPFTAVGAGGEALFVKVLDPDPRDRDLMYRAARFLAWRDVRDEAEAGDAVARAEHEAAMAMLAAAAGCCTPAVRRVAGDRTVAVLVQDLVDGPSLDVLAGGGAGPAGAGAAAAAGPRRARPHDGGSGRAGAGAGAVVAALPGTWRQVERLHAAGLAHRDLGAANVVVDRGGQPWLVDLAHTQNGATPTARDNDVAELLASTALLAGPATAVRAAAEVLAPDRLAAALPELQPLALTAATRAALRGRPGLLEELRATLADAAGAQLPPPHPLPAFRPVAAIRVLACGVAGAVALVLLAGPGDVADALSTPGYRWLGLGALAMGAATLLRGAAMAAATGRHLGVGRMAVLRVVAAATGALHGREAAHDVVLRSLERSGLSPRDAAQATAWEGAVRTVLSGVLVGGGLMAAVLSGGDWRVPPHALAGVAVVVVLAAAGGLRWPRPTAADVEPRPPARASSMPLLVATGAGALLAGALVAVAATEAFHGGAAIGAVVAVTGIAGWFGAAAPATGAPGAAEVALGMGLAAAGMPMGAAAASALAYRLIAHWGRLVVGAACTSALDRWLVI